MNPQNNFAARALQLWGVKFFKKTDCGCNSTKGSFGKSSSIFKPMHPHQFPEPLQPTR